MTHHISKTIGALAVAATFAFPVFAADMPVKAPAVHAPAPMLNWTGCYIGGNAGYGWSHQTWYDFPTNVGSDTGNGFVGGGQLGCDYQVGNFVFGVQGMFDGADLSGSHPYTTSPEFIDHTKASWFATVTGRVGYAISPATLVYAKGGVAWVRDKYAEGCPPGTLGYVCPGQATATRTGWTVGGGMEYRFLQNWSWFAEYNYMDFGTHRVNLTYPPLSGTANYPYNIKQSVQAVLLGINYRY